MAVTVLVVDDDADLREVIACALHESGLAVAEASNAEDALEQYGAHRPELVILDIGLGAVDGLEVCRRLRALGDVPILFLTSRSNEVDELVGFAAGGDDYMTKPFSPRLLQARVTSLLRRGPASAALRTTLAAGPLRLDTEGRTVQVESTSVELTRTEFDLLAVLMENPRRVIARDELVDRVWGSWYGDDHVVEVQMSRLRSKIIKAGGPKVGVAVRGVGYRLGVVA